MTDRPAETFAHLIQLHLDNDEGTYSARRELVSEALAGAYPSDLASEVYGDDKARHLAARADVADSLRDFVTALAFDADPEDPHDSGTVTLLAQDLLTQALGMVDWFDMADDYIAEAREEV